MGADWLPIHVCGRGTRERGREGSRTEQYISVEAINCKLISSEYNKRYRLKRKLAEAEFKKQFLDNKSGFVCSACDRLWFEKDLRPIPRGSIGLLATEFPGEGVSTFRACNTCYQLKCCNKMYTWLLLL